MQKVSFRLGGNGLAGGTEEFRHDGFRGGRLTALVAGANQIGTVNWHNGLWVQYDGYEYPLVLVVSAALALTGPGRWSADHVLGLAPWPLWVSVAAVVIGPASGLLTRVVLRRPPAPGRRTPHVQAAD